MDTCSIAKENGKQTLYKQKAKIKFIFQATSPSLSFCPKLFKFVSEAISGVF